MCDVPEPHFVPTFRLKRPRTLINLDPANDDLPCAVWMDESLKLLFAENQLVICFVGGGGGFGAILNPVV